MSFQVGGIQNSTKQRVGDLENASVNESNIEVYLFSLITSCFFFNQKETINLHVVCSALEDGKVEGVLLDTYIAAEHKDDLFNDKIFVKELLNRPFGYGVFLLGAAGSMEQRCQN